MSDIVDRLDVVGSYPEEREAKAEILKLREQVAALQASSGYEASIAQVEIERLRSTLGYLADHIDNPALVAVAENALKSKALLP